MFDLCVCWCVLMVLFLLVVEITAVFYSSGGGPEDAPVIMTVFLEGCDANLVESKHVRHPPSTFND